jgi:hypothetical protein
MPRKQWFLVTVTLVLAAVYVCFFTGWFQHREIGISSTNRASLARFGIAGSSPAVAFGLNQEYQLTEVKVVPLAAWQTNPAVLPLWHLVGDRKSGPIQFLLYGENIRGMKPAAPGATPEPLEAGVAYRLFVSAGSIKGQHDFWVGHKPPEATNSASQ